MNRKIAALLVVVIVFMIVIFLFISNQPRDRPSFEIAYFNLREQPFGYVQFMFSLKNNGTANASHVHGVMVFTEHWDSTWHLIPEDYVLEPGMTSPVVIVGVNGKPNVRSINITVECDEGVIQRFTQPMPS